MLAAAFACRNKCTYNMAARQHGSEAARQHGSCREALRHGRQKEGSPVVWRWSGGGLNSAAR